MSTAKKPRTKKRLRRAIDRLIRGRSFSIAEVLLVDASGLLWRAEVTDVFDDGERMEIVVRIPKAGRA